MAGRDAPRRVALRLAREPGGAEASGVIAGSQPRPSDGRRPAVRLRRDTSRPAAFRSSPARAPGPGSEAGRSNRRQRHGARPSPRRRPPPPSPVRGPGVPARSRTPGWSPSPDARRTRRTRRPRLSPYRHGSLTADASLQARVNHSSRSSERPRTDQATTGKAAASMIV